MLLRSCGRCVRELLPPGRLTARLLLLRAALVATICAIPLLLPLPLLLWLARCC